MAYDKAKIYEQALELSQKKKLFYIEQVVAFLPIAKKTFYEWFPVDSNECNAIKEILDKNKIEVSSSLMKKWYDSDNATLQMGLMKMIGTDEIRKALSTNWNNSDITSKGEKIQTTIIVQDLATKDNLERLNNEND